jgi:hypothetical protein
MKRTPGIRSALALATAYGASVSSKALITRFPHGDLLEREVLELHVCHIQLVKGGCGPPADLQERGINCVRKWSSAEVARPSDSSGTPIMESSVDSPHQRRHITAMRVPSENRSPVVLRDVVNSSVEEAEHRLVERRPMASAAFWRR